MKIATVITTPRIETVDVQTYSAGQDANYCEILRCAGRTWRVYIHADTSYATQSRAHIEMWTPTGWIEVARLMGALVKNSGLYTHDRNGIPAGQFGPGKQVPIPTGFLNDRDRLLSLALATTRA